jgi:hypothetical protein
LDADRLADALATGADRDPTRGRESQLACSAIANYSCVRANLGNRVTSMSSFQDLARKIGLNLDRLNDGEVIRTSVRVKTIAEFKELFAGSLDPQRRSAYSAQLESGDPKRSTGNSPDLLWQRLHNHVYGAGQLSDSDATAAARFFPITVQVVSGANYVLDTDETFGPSAVPVLLNFATLTIDGGSITTLNTILTLQADTVTFGPRPGTKPYHFGVLGVDGAPGGPGSPGITPIGQASPGSNSKQSAPGICQGAPAGGPGSPGAAGGKGGTGNPGHDGLPALEAVFTISGIDRSKRKLLKFYTRSGGGGTGGTGGIGGTGQQGGNGGTGCIPTNECKGTDGGSGGNGGTGGTGGDGGAGGNGVDGNSILINLPAVARSSIATKSDIAAAGTGGQPGQGGDGGAGGGGGKGGKGAQNGAAGATGDAGQPGTPGNDGAMQGKPGAFILPDGT